MFLKPVPDDLRLLAEAPSPHRVRKVSWRGQDVWIKKATKSKSTVWHFLQKIFFLLAPLDILRPTVSGGGAEALAREAECIEAFQKAGFIAPQVIALSSGWIILGDLGTVIDTEIKTSPDMTAEKISAVAAACAREIARLHAAGLSHGRCKLNDLVRLQDGRIGFIDFEERAEGIPLPVRQARELWLFFASLARYRPLHQGIIGDALAAYKDARGSRAALTELERLLKLLRPFVFLLGPLAQIAGGDLARARAATRDLLLLAENGL